MAGTWLAPRSAGTRWWGWGDPPPGLGEGGERVAEIVRLLGEPPRGTAPVEPDALAPPDSRLLASARDALARHAEIDLGPRARSLACFGSAYPDLVRRRRGECAPAPDAVVRPPDVEALVGVVRACSEHDLAIVPRGGGTSLVGGADASGVAERAGLVTVDLGRMTRVLDLDGVAGRVSCEAGITGPALEVALRDAGFALGHHPASFERSTVGGWLATGAVGQDATGIGPIADSVRSVALVAGTGLVETGSAPGAAEGPDLLDLLIGSEGAFGVIARATLALRPRPAAQAGAALLFGSFADGLAALRRLAQAGAAPSFVRLCDAAETRLALCDAPDERRARRARAREGALLLLVETGAAGPTGTRVREAVEACAPESPAELGQAVARRAIEARYHEPYVRDALVEAGVIVDTIDTSASWSALPALREAIVSALTGALGARSLVACRVPHAYRDGASLEVTYLAPVADGEEIEVWRRARTAALGAILADGAAISHHSGIGTHHARWLARARGRGAEAVLRSVKEEFDPLGLMNPGKLLPDDEPRFL